MFAASSIAAGPGAWRRSRLTLLAVSATALLVVGQVGSGVVLGAHPDHSTKPGNGQTTPAATPSPTPTPEPSDSPATTQPASKTAPKGDPAPLTADQQRVENVITAAKQYLGIAYRVGSEGPTLFDCSGLVFRAFSDAGLVDRIGGARLRAAGYMRWFASRGLMTTDESLAQRGDLVIYNNGSHIGIYLGDGRVESALINPFGVTVHPLHGVSLPVTGFLRPDWSGDGKVAPFVPVDLPDVPEAPVTLVPAADWMPALDPAVVAPAAREGTERPDLRTLNSRTYANGDGTFTTEFHAQPIFFQPPGTTKPADLQPIDTTFLADEKTGYATVATSPVAVTTRPTDDPAGFVTASAGVQSVSLSVHGDAGASASKSVPTVLDDGRVVDYFDFQPQGVGLRVLAQTDGFKSFIVMGKQPDHTRFSFVLDAAGLTPVVADDGSIVLTRANGATAGRIPRPLLLDSSDIDGNGGGVFTAATSLSVDTSGAKPVINVAVDPSYLDEAVFPAYVDLSLTEFPTVSTGADVAFASTAHPNASLHGFQRPESAGYDELWLGHQPNSHDDNSVYVRFEGLTSVLGTVDVASASLELLPYFEKHSDGVAVVHRVAADWSADSLTWTTQPALDEAQQDQGTVSDESGSWSTLDVSSYVTGVLSQAQPDFGLALSGDGSAAATWTRFAASDAGNSAEYGPRLVVTWSGLRPSPVAVANVPDAPSGTLPALTWTQPQLAGAQSRFEVQVSHDGFTTIDVDSGSVNGKAGKLAAWTMPANSLTSGGSYSWRVRVKYGTDKTWSAWSAASAFALAVPARSDVPHAANLAI
jgi:cell wall-associated NlpC family hydrolase